mgnify:CR=1 FL=1
MINIKNLKYYATTFTLATVISLLGCSTDKSSDIIDLVGEKIVFDNVEENAIEKKNDIVNSINEIEDNSKEIIFNYDISSLYLNFCLSKTYISDNILI